MYGQLYGHCMDNIKASKSRPACSVDIWLVGGGPIRKPPRDDPQWVLSVPWNPGPTYCIAYNTGHDYVKDDQYILLLLLEYYDGLLTRRGGRVMGVQLSRHVKVWTQWKWQPAEPRQSGIKHNALCAISVWIVDDTMKGTRVWWSVIFYCL